MACKLKIAQLVPYYSPVIGGVEVVCQTLSEELARRGHNVHVFTANRVHKGSPHIRMPQDEIINGVKVHRFRSYIQIGHHGLFPGFVAPLAKGTFDIIHAHGYRQPQSEIGWRIGTLLKVPTILHVHGGFYTHSRAKRVFYDLYDSLARRQQSNVFDHFIALSEADQQRLIGLNIDPRKITIIRNAADKQAFEDTEDTDFIQKHNLQGKKVILYLSILHQYKRPDLLIRALPKIIAKVPEAFLLFVGPDAGELTKVETLAKELGVSDRYKFIGPLQGTEKHQAFSCSEFLALPSDEDPYPLVLLEAMAHGKPVLTTDVTGQSSLIRDNVAGIVIPPGDLDGIIKGSVDLLLNKAYKDTLGSNAKELAVRMFSPIRVADEVESLYRQLIREKTNSRPDGSAGTL